ncbi:M23 family metallopeptidase [Superficieibacter sp. HKU1]|uniref:M23 family metallopeptidase n=1 Tax=Superficieibacter sp. HKU1 TaxID=3031919 RepID=UPI0023E33DBA|nr:M23 family metallopeptidase [Superficieibacter sp. HKU1]WES67873.1 M23 family metallopeptidase [Superficieibacter sp. HKU1]
MSFLLLSGALLTANPVYRIEPECYYSTYAALMHAKKADTFRTGLGILPPPDSVTCHRDATEITLATLADYQAAFRMPHSLIPVLDEDEPSFDAARLFVTKESVTAEATEEDADAIAQAESPVNNQDLTVGPSDEDVGSSVFSVMNATIPTMSAPPPVWKPLLSQQAQSGRFIFPLTTPLNVTSPYGLRYHPVIHSFMRHEGTDFRAANNSEVMSIADGQVVEASYGPVTGFYITIRHADGWSSRYLHLNQLKVFKNQYVKKGNVIGLSGNTGRTNGPHLHLEISHNDRLLDPMTVLFEQRQSSSPVSAPAPVTAPEPIDMTPKIAVVSGEGSDLQIGVRIGKTVSMYNPQEMIETDEGKWRIVKKFGKYKLLKVQPPVADEGH